MITAVHGRKVTILTNALARLLVQEATIGITAGHAEVEAVIEAVLGQFAGEGDLPALADSLLARPVSAD